MMRAGVIVVLTAGAGSLTLRHNPDDIAFSFHKDVSQTSASSSDATSAASEVYARLNAQQADSAAQRTGHSVLRAKTNHLAVQGAVRESLTSLQATKDAAAEAQEYYDHGATIMATVDAESAIAGKAGLEHLSPLYKNLADWQWQTMHDPLKEATKAGQRAAAPFNQALRVVETRRGDYEQRAKALSDTAQSLKSVAFGVAAGAVAKQAHGQGESAQRDLQNAHHMVLQAQNYEANSVKIMDQAQQWAANIPAYQGAADIAAHTAEHTFLKSAYSAPPVASASAGLTAPTGAFLPILIQKTNE